MCKETKIGLATGLLMIIIMAIGFRTGDQKKDDTNPDLTSGKIVREKKNVNQEAQFQTTSRSQKSGPTLE